MITSKRDSLDKFLGYDLQETIIFKRVNFFFFNMKKTTSCQVQVPDG